MEYYNLVYQTDEYRTEHHEKYSLCIQYSIQTQFSILRANRRISQGLRFIYARYQDSEVDVLNNTKTKKKDGITIKVKIKQEKTM
jgi:hypothetical protein